jgi:hypothetical protein
MPIQASAHPPGAAAAPDSMFSAALARTPFSNGTDARALVTGMRLEQHRGARGGSPSRAGGGGTFGHAVPRTSAPFGRRFLPHRFFFSPFTFGAFGLGFAYDPFFWGGYPFGWGAPYWGWGYPYGAYGYRGYGGYGYDYGYPAQRGYERYGSVKLDVKPGNAEVYVDGYYMGQARDFGGTFHHLDLAGGDHKIEIRANGYQPLTVDLKIMAGRTVNYRAELKRGSSAPDR